MAAAVALMNSDRTADPDPALESGESSAFHRNIEFHISKKPYNGLSNNSNGFKMLTLNPSSDNSEPHMAAGSDKKCDGTDLAETGLDPELSFRITFKRIGAGLRNLGNTCFLNSVLQCLTYTEPLAAYLQSGKHQNSCRTAGFCALCAIQRHVSRALQSTGRILEPKDLVSNLRCISRNFRNARQEDAHEYMVNLLESMHKCCLPSGVPCESPSAYEKSLVHKIFGGRLRSQVKCMQCSFCSNKFDPFLDLSLEIMKADSLYKALTHFTAKEQLDGGARQYQCQQCKQKVEALKQLTIHDAPHVLSIHLKRFDSYVHGQKIDRKIEFGPTLDLKPFVSGPYDGDLKYTLYGVLVHAGWSTHSGHYYCFVRTSSGMWYSLDDNQVVHVNERRVLEQKGLHKENIFKNGLGNAAYSKSNPELKENIQNGSTEIKLDGSFSPTSVERDALNGTATEETPMKVGSVHKVNGRMAVECLKRNTELEPFSVIAPPKDTVKGISAANINSVDHLVKSVSPVKVSGDVLNLDHAAKIVDCNDGYNAQPDLNSPAAVLPYSKEPQVSLNKEELNDFVAMPSSCSKDTIAKEDQSNTLIKKPNSIVLCISSGDVCNTEGMNSGKCENKTTSVKTNAEALTKIGFTKSLKKSSIEESRVGCSPRKSGDLTAKDTLDISPKGIGFQSESITGLPATVESLLPRKVNDKKLQLKVKKKAFKCQVGSMQLSSIIIFGVAFCLRKKNKRRKYCSLLNNNLSSENLLDGNVPSDLGPSTSEKSLPASSGHSFYPQRKRVKFGSVDKGKASSVLSSTGNCKVPRDINNEVRKRIAPNGTILATEKKSQRSLGSASERKQSAAEEPSISEGQRRETLNSMMSMLTRGLEESNVARWDDVDISTSETTGSRGVEAVQIGYIGDEWDEEYDRGKRKKVNGSKINFGGPNLFQEIATKNQKRKKVKLDRSSSGNQPFRI
ncbi:Ubiquitin carboxyl-terminal hydrolase 23 [Abeliophyllum distichum]|uniref:Ubiquitin carboxyl-terminal hydrolase n=1 Tax=Abeliophyllum distichum TaxID=126358 RepID=A0ABD1PP09_9LAMI